MRERCTNMRKPGALAKRPAPRIGSPGLRL